MGARLGNVYGGVTYGLEGRRNILVLVFGEVYITARSIWYSKLSSRQRFQNLKITGIGSQEPI